jgi:AcrR family transcriptional regulator
MRTAKSRELHDIQDTKGSILETARKMFSENGYLGVSMQDIAKKMNITKAALYYHFSGKAEVYENVIDEVFDALAITITKSLGERTTGVKLNRLIRDYLDFGAKEKNLIRVIMLKTAASDSRIVKHIVRQRERLVHSIEPLIKEVGLKKELPQDVDSYLLASLLTCMMDGLLLEHALSGKKIDSERVSSQIISLLF